MDRKQLDMLPLVTRIAAQDAVLVYLIQNMRLLLAALPDAVRLEILAVMKRKLDAAREEYRQMTFPGIPPEQSDAAAGEFQDAFDRLVRRLEESFGLPK